MIYELGSMIHDQCSVTDALWFLTYEICDMKHDVYMIYDV